MKTFLRAAIVGAAAFAFTAGATAQEQPNIVEAAQATDSLSTLVTAVDAAGLVGTLSGDGPFTVFAPTNEAFEALPAGALDNLLEDTDALTAVLTYHVVPGEVMSGALVELIQGHEGSAMVETVNGATIEAAIEGGNVILTDNQGNEATVVLADVDVSNGVVHVIDGVLLP
jgi:uncharacterized surface protein with fasciclin (FAS1) repeats